MTENPLPTLKVLPWENGLAPCPFHREAAGHFPRGVGPGPFGLFCSHDPALPAFFRGSGLPAEPRRQGTNRGRDEAAPADRGLPVACGRLRGGGRACLSLIKGPGGQAYEGYGRGPVHGGWGDRGGKGGFSDAVPAPRKVFGLPPSVLRCFAQEPVGAVGTYKAAVDSFLQQQHTLGTERAGGSPGPAQGEERQSQPCPQGPAGPPPAAQTEALSRLFGSVKTLTAKEELLHTLR